MGHHEYSKTTVVIQCACWLVACGGDVEAADFCSAASSSEPCDVSQPTCQLAVLALVAAERGEPVPPLPSIRIDTAGVKAMGSPPPLLSLPGTFSWDAALAALGLLPVGKSSTLARGKLLETYDAWYYDPTDQQIVVQHHDTLPQDPRDAMSQLAHELDHYMQDRAVGIAALYEGHDLDTDRSSAVSTLIEGEATMVGFRVQARVYGEDPDAVDWQTQLDAREASYLARVDGSNAPLSTATGSLVYTIGARYISKLWAAYGREQVARLFSARPEIMADWFSDSVRGELAPSLLEPVGCEAPIAPAGYELKGTTSLGVLGALALTAAGGGAQLTLSAALRGDALHYYAATGESHDLKLSSERGIALWDLIFADEDAARHFGLALQNAPVVRAFTGRRVRVIASLDPTLELSALFQSSHCL
jgi:hypothetical protein